MTEEQKQKLRDYQKNRYNNMTEEQKQTLRENNKKHNESRNERRKFSNITDEQKQKIRDYQREYHKKYYAAKKLIIHKIFKIIYHIKNYKRV